MRAPLPRIHKVTVGDSGAHNRPRLPETVEGVSLFHGSPFFRVNDHPLRRHSATADVQV